LCFFKERELKFYFEIKSRPLKTVLHINDSFLPIARSRAMIKLLPTMHVNLNYFSEEGRLRWVALAVGGEEGRLLLSCCLFQQGDLSLSIYFLS